MAIRDRLPLLIVKGVRDDGDTVFWTGAPYGKPTQFMTDRQYAYPVGQDSAAKVVDYFNAHGLRGYRFDTEPYVLPV